MMDYSEFFEDEEYLYNPEPPLEDMLLQDDLYEWLDATKEELGLDIFDVTILRNGDLLLNQIIVPRDSRKSGVGTQVMEWLCQLADHHGIRIWLTPMKKNREHGTTSMRRLVDFYKRFGFVLNRGRNKDYRLQEMMYRRPQN